MINIRKTAKKEFKFNISKTQMTVILSGVYIFLQMTADIAASKLTYFGPWVMDAGIIYALTFTWRDVIHKQLGKKAAQTAIILAGAINILMALYFLLVIMLPAETQWAAQGGQIAWKFIFGLVPRIVIASIIAEVFSELVDTEVYQWWVKRIGKNKPQFLRVFVSNAVSIPLDSIIFPLIAFAGVVDIGVIFQMFLTGILVKCIITLLSFWMIYLVPERPLYRAGAEDE